MKRMWIKWSAIIKNQRKSKMTSSWDIICILKNKYTLLWLKLQSTLEENSLSSTTNSWVLSSINLGRMDKTKWEWWNPVIYKRSLKEKKNRSSGNQPSFSPLLSSWVDFRQIIPSLCLTSFTYKRGVKTT